MNVTFLWSNNRLGYLGRVMTGICKFGGGTIVLLATCSAAIAADLAPNLPVKAPVGYVTKAQQAPAANGYDWNGWYIGVHVGVTTGSSNWSATQPGAPGLNGSFDLPYHFDFMAGTGSYVAGLQGGYNHVFKSHWMLGFETDLSFPNSDVLIPFSVRGSQTVTSPFTGQVTYGEAVIYSGTVRGRARLCLRSFSALWHRRVGLDLRSGDAYPDCRFSGGRNRDTRNRGHVAALASGLGRRRGRRNPGQRKLDRKG